MKRKFEPLRLLSSFASDFKTVLSQEKVTIQISLVTESIAPTCRVSVHRSQIKIIIKGPRAQIFQVFKAIHQWISKVDENAAERCILSVHNLVY